MSKFVLLCKQLSNYPKPIQTQTLQQHYNFEIDNLAKEINTYSNN
jgi:hypothetical protein